MPNSLIDCPVQSLRKSECAQRPSPERPTHRRPAGRAPRRGRTRRRRRDSAARKSSISFFSRRLRRLASASVSRARTTPKVVRSSSPMRKHLLGGAAEGGGDEVPDVLAVRVGALEEEQSCDAAVELLGHGAHLPRPDDVHESRLLEHLHVVPDGALRQPELLGELGRRERTVAQEEDDLRAEIVAERTKLLGLPHDEHVVGLVVRRGDEPATIPECTGFPPVRKGRSRERPGPGPNTEPARGPAPVLFPARPPGP